MSKKCAYCNKILPDEFFCKNKRNKDGLHSYCKSCNASKAKIYNQTKGKEKMKVYQKRQRESGYYRFGHGAYVNMKKSAKNRCVPFSITEEELALWWKSNCDICAYCGSTVDEYLEIKEFIKNFCDNDDVIKYLKEHVYNKEIYYNIESMTIDRMDSSKGYEIENLVKSCWICNSIKSNLYS